MGKTGLTMTIALRTVVQCGKTVAIFELEKTKIVTVNNFSK